jgi:superfamily II DNA/RNA helicase
MSFADLGLSDGLLKAVEDAGYTQPTPIQAEAIPPVLMMKDLIGIAQTGTGKTASFVLPMIDILDHGRRRARMPRSLILEPTRELAAQVAENFEKYGANADLKMALLIGGVQMGDQIKALDEGVDVLIATPGRLMDLFERGKILMTGCNLLVIDEADRMLDMGFIPDIETICEKLPAERQTLLFSATMPPPIKKLADRFLTNPKHIEVARPASANINITQLKFDVAQKNKRELLTYLLKTDDVHTAIVFANRKTTVRELAKHLNAKGFAAGEIHGDMDQASRIKELDRFKKGEINILCASDVAARGLDVKGVSHVFNFDTPWHPDDYVHRIGRTGRAGASGRAFTFVAPDDAEAIANVQKLIGTKIEDWQPPKAPKKTESAPAQTADDDEGQREERKPRARKPRRDDDADRAPRDDRKPRRNEREADDAAAAPRRAKKSDSSRKSTRRAEEEPVEPGEWNGPRPGFLDISAL